jgi:hypothetical protein
MTIVQNIIRNIFQDVIQNFVQNEEESGTSNYCSLAYSVLASFRIGRSGSASFQRVRKSL